MTRVPDEADLRRRAVRIDGAFNFRDVGGYETTDGVRARLVTRHAL